MIQKRSDGADYGVCLFSDIRQCEEWAMLRGECPVGGVKINGYITQAARYCVITGGKYRVADFHNTDRERGTCTFRSGRSCDAQAYFLGRCDPIGGVEDSTYSDPFEYCQAVGTIDAPDQRYRGARIPESIFQGMIRKGIASEDSPPEFLQNAVWRCMNHQVWVCHFGANLPCLERADTSQAPTPGMADYCRSNPSADYIPAAVTGRATVYQWRCRDGRPEALRQIFAIDPQGYLADFWYELAPQEEP